MNQAVQIAASCSNRSQVVSLYHVKAALMTAVKWTHGHPEHYWHPWSSLSRDQTANCVEAAPWGQCWRLLAGCLGQPQLYYLCLPVGAHPNLPQSLRLKRAFSAQHHSLQATFCVLRNSWSTLLIFKWSTNTRTFTNTVPLSPLSWCCSCGIVYHICDYLKCYASECQGDPRQEQWVLWVLKPVVAKLHLTLIRQVRNTHSLLQNHFYSLCQPDPMFLPKLAQVQHLVAERAYFIGVATPSRIKTETHTHTLWRCFCKTFENIHYEIKLLIGHCNLVTLLWAIPIRPHVGDLFGNLFSHFLLHWLSLFCFLLG